MNGALLDDLDRQLIDLLSRDARVSNRRIAAELGVTEGTIRGRIKRLQQENLIRFTAVTNAAHAGSLRLVFIGVHVDQTRLREVAAQVAEVPRITGVIITLGRFQVLAIGLFSELDEIWDVAHNQILSIPGVRHVESTVAVRTIKYDSRTAKITRSFTAPDDDENGEDDE